MSIEHDINTFQRIDRGHYIWYDHNENEHIIYVDTSSLLPSIMSPLTNLCSLYEFHLDNNDNAGADIIKRKIIEWLGDNY